MSQKLRVAAICTIYYAKSHADAIVTKFLKGMSTDEGFFAPEVEVVSLYIDHVLETDIGFALAEEHGVPIYQSIRRALHAGAKELDVDAVLLIGEHGDYPWNERGRQMYPRRYFFEQIAGVFAESGRSVPVFSDKHFAYDFCDAQWMWDRAQKLEIPLMAGSCLPLAWRRPWLEYEQGTPVEEALAVGYGGIEAYGYHTIETLLCMVERRTGGETGVASVQCLEGQAVWRARDEGLFAADLAAAACAAVEDKAEGTVEEHAKKPAVFLIEHRDGLRTACLMVNGYVRHWSYAGRVAGKVEATECFLQPDGPGANFGYLSQNIQRFFATGRAPYPPERTLLATGIIDAAMNSRYEDHRRVETPHLDVAYRSYEVLPLRPRGPRPTGACLDRAALDLLIEWQS
jgi:hypothetical protein